MHEGEERVLRDRIESTRERMAGTVGEIGSRVNPDRVQAEIKARARGEMRELKSTMKRKARGTMRDLGQGVEDRGRGIWRTIKDNPVPATLVGVGMAWMAANGSSRSSGEHRSPSGLSGPAEHYGPEHGAAYPARPGAGAGTWTGHPGEPGRGSESESESAVSRAKGQLEEVADHVRETGSDATDRARRRASEAVDATRERASELADDGADRIRAARRTAMRAERRVEDAVRENPLAAGAFAAVLGMAAGFMVPESQREHDLLGPTRDRALDRAQDTARSAANSARETVRDAAADAARSAVDEVFPDDEGPDERAVTEPGRGV